MKNQLERARKFDWRFHHHDDPHLRALISKVGHYCGGLPNGEWLTLIGAPGCGKTHLARRSKAFWNRHCIKPCFRIRYGLFREWSSVLTDIFDKDKKHVIGELADAGLLVIDDIGAEHSSGFSTSKLLELLNARVGKPTILTSNVSVETMREHDPRLFSRLNRHGEIFTSQASDYALRCDRITAAPTVPSARSVDEESLCADDLKDHEIQATFRRLAKALQSDV